MTVLSSVAAAENSSVTLSTVNPNSLYDPSPNGYSHAQDGVFRQGGCARFAQDTVGGGGNVRRAVYQRTVQVEDDGQTVRLCGAAPFQGSGTQYFYPFLICATLTALDGQGSLDCRFGVLVGYLDDNLCQKKISSRNFYPG